MIQTEETQAMIDEIVKGIPLNRIVTPKDVSKLVLLLASDESSYSTGSEFTIDGGLTASN